jgi:phosphoglycolate phosphatase-like HAD superfamily hydrolase
MGVSRFEKFRWISENLLKQPVTEDYLQSQGKRFSEICFEQIINAPFIPGVLSVLEWCKHNAQAFVVSGTPEGELKLIIAQRDLEGFFVEVCGTPRVKVEISKELLSRYRLDPTTCWFIGDGHTDQEAAYEVGIPFVAVDSIEMHAHWSALAGKLWLVNDLREVANFLYGV